MTKKVTPGLAPGTSEPSLFDATSSEPEHSNGQPQQDLPIDRAGGTARRKRPPAAGVPRHYSLKRLAEHWDVSPRTLRRMIDGGELRATMIRGQLRVPEDEVQGYERRHRR